MTRSRRSVGVVASVSAAASASAPFPAAASSSSPLVAAPNVGGADLQLFSNLRGWFAPTPVCRSFLSSWLHEGGIHVLDTADPIDYFFSDRPEDPITKRIQSGPAPLLVFKPNWIQESIQVGQRVPIGRYLLQASGGGDGSGSGSGDGSGGQTLVGRYFEQRHRAAMGAMGEVGPDGRPMPYHGAITIEEIEPITNKATRKRLSKAARAAQAEEEARAAAPRLSGIVAPAPAQADAAPTPAASSNPSAAPLTYRLPDWSGFHKYVTSMSIANYAPPLIASASPVTHAPAPVSAPSESAPPEATQANTNNQTKKKKGTKRKDVTPPAEQTENGVVAGSAAAASSSPVVAASPAALPAVPASHSVLSSFHHVPPLPRDRFFSTHWIRHRSVVGLDTLMPFVSPRYSTVVSIHAPTTTEEETNKTAKKGRGKGKKQAAVDAPVDASPTVQSPSLAPLASPPIPSGDAHPTGAPAAAAPSSPATQQSPRPTKKRRKVSSAVKSSQPAVGARSVEPSLRLSAADYEAVDATLNESTLNSLRLIAASIGCRVEPPLGYDFRALREDEEWRSEFKTRLLRHWAKVAPPK